MQFQSHDGKLLIEPIADYSPHIGVLVSTMQRCRDTTILLVKDLTVAQLDYLFDEEDNSIGALLLHLASLEAGYQEITFFNRNILDNPERLPKWLVPMDAWRPGPARDPWPSCQLLPARAGADARRDAGADAAARR